MSSLVGGPSMVGGLGPRKFSIFRSGCCRST